LFLVIIFLSIAIHEFAHAWTADMAGDPTPRFYGRVTLNPLAHLDPMGSIMIIFTTMAGFGIGWGKPVLVNPSKMRNPRWDHFFSVAAGPLSNLIQAAIYALTARLLVGAGVIAPMVENQIDTVGSALLFGVIVNINLAFFNLIPFGPLDGHWLVGLMMPEKPRYHWFKFCHTAGGPILLAVILLSQFQGFSITRFIFGAPIDWLTRFLLGF
ncbi:MAG: site-2 protease family protein, partial [Fimbriimonadaceae bacterium]